jgi:hypothetical protein
MNYSRTSLVNVFSSGLALLALLLLMRLDANAQVSVTTNNGERYLGTVVDDTMEWIRLVSSDSVTITIPKSNVQLIQYGVDAPGGRSSFWVLGGAFGSPGIANLVGGYYFNGWGVRVSGGMIPFSAGGVQIEVLKNLSSTQDFSHNLHLGVGSLFIDNGSSFWGYDWWDYIAIGYDLNWHGFYVSGDLSFGEGTYSSPQILGQIGYVYEFR